MCFSHNNGLSMDRQSVFDRIGLKNMNGGREKRKNLSSTVKLYKR